jgi:hypothetical protein
LTEYPGDATLPLEAEVPGVALFEPSLLQPKSPLASASDAHTIASNLM